MIRSQSQTLITGVYRVGSEYLTQLLDSHPNISSSMYRVNLIRFTLGKFGNLSVESNLNNAILDLNNRLNERYQMSVDADVVKQMFSSSKSKDYWTFYDIIMSHLYCDSKVIHWAEKNQLLWRDIPDFVTNMPNGKSIIIIRDPRSVLASFKKYTFVPEPAYLEAIFNCYDCLKFAKLYQEQLNEDRFLLLKYEECALDPKSAKEKMFGFLGLETGLDSVLIGNKDAYGKDWFANSSFHSNEDNSSAFNVNSAINRWKNNLSDEEVFLTECICSEYMEFFGYELSHRTGKRNNIFKKVLEDKRLSTFFQKWAMRSEGIQEFPVDPLLKDNWEENKSE